ncbi:MAG: YdcF family protein [Verrucomicrobia bacterium]|nr:YdcF family protein [Verrucomicrobiota bacterium]
MTRLLEPIFQPIGVLWLLHVVATIWMARRRQWRESFFCGTIATGILLVGSTALPARLLASLERPYATTQLERIPDCDAVVMLGGTLSASRSDVLGFDLGEAADRIFTAIELWKKKKAETLIVGGGGGERRVGQRESWSEGQLIIAWLAQQGVSDTNVVHLTKCANTREEAQKVAVLAKERNWKRVILVTSGYHMKRAAGLFTKLGIPVESVACDFVGINSLENARLGGLFPEIGGFHHLELFLHEWMGWFYYRLRGWV